MRVAHVSAYGGPEVLVSATAPRPAPGPGEVLVAVTACGVGAWDLKRRAGLFGSDPGALPIILGTELCGIVVELGAGVEGLETGVRVFGFAGSGSGANAEYVRVPAGDLAPAPDDVGDDALAASPVGLLTAWQTLVEQLQVASGDRVLITGAAGGWAASRSRSGGCWART